MNQKNLILKHMQMFGSITPVDAMREYGCMRLAARISDIREDGHRVGVTFEKGLNRFGDQIKYAKYYLED